MWCWLAGTRRRPAFWKREQAAKLLNAGGWIRSGRRIILSRFAGLWSFPLSCGPITVIDAAATGQSVVSFSSLMVGGIKSTVFSSATCFLWGLGSTRCITAFPSRLPEMYVIPVIRY